MIQSQLLFFDTFSHDSQSVGGVQDLNLDLLPLEDLLSFPAPLCFLVCLAEGGSEDHLLVLQLLDSLVLERNNPLIWLLQTENCFSLLLLNCRNKTFI